MKKPNFSAIIRGLGVAITLLLPANNVYAADTNLQSPTQDVATAAGSGGDGFELNPTNAYSDGGGVASNIDGAGDQHIYYGYDLSAIPAGDIVDGIEVRLDWYLDNVAATNSISVQLSWDGGTTWTTAQSTTPTEPIAEATTTLGGPANNWGHTWSVTASNATNELSSTNFRVRVNSNSSSTFRDFFLDWVPVRVYSHTPPEIDIQGNAISITDGDIIPVVADDTEFGSAGLGSTVDHTFTIFNTGSGTLNLSNVTLTGSTSFLIQTPPAASIPSGGSTTFVIRFAPNTAGVSNSKTATFSVDTDDPDENPYTFDVHGTRLINEITIRGNGLTITDGDGTPSLLDSTNWGNVGQGVAVDRIFTINNTGTANLTIGAITFVGGNAGDFSVVSAPASLILPSGSTTFTIRLTAGAIGIRSTTIDIVNDDIDENPYDFAIQGNGVAGVPEIEVLGNGVTITDGDISPSLTDGSNFDNVFVGDSTVLTYTIRNNGAANLTIGAFTFTGDFSLATAPTTPVSAGGSTTFQMRFTPASVGGINGTVSFVNSDTSENPYNFSLTGTGVANTAPNTPSSVGQYKTDATTVIAQGGLTNQTQAVFKSTTTDPDGHQYQLEVEVVPVVSAFINTATCTSTLVNSGTEANTGACGSFTNGTSYKWQYRVTDSLGASTAWTPFGASDPDFTIDTSVPILSSVHIQSNNADTTLAKVGDTVTVSFTSSENITTPTVTIAGNTATVAGGPTNWSATYVMAAGDTEGLVSFNISAFSDGTSNAGSAVLATTDASSVTFDKTAPTVTITSIVTNPTNTSPIPVTIIFSEAVSGFVIGDITVGNGAASNFNTTDNITFTTDITPTANGLVTVDVAANVAQDGTGNNNTIATQFSITYDNTNPSVTINQAAGQLDPTNSSPINFTATFSKPINTATFTAADTTIGGTASGTLAAIITEIAPNDGTTFNIAVSSMIGSGTVIASITANTVQDTVGNNNTASTSTDNTVTYDLVNPTVVSTTLTASYTGTGPGSFIATFNKLVDDPVSNTGTDDVTNPANFLLVDKGTNSVANTVSCASGVVSDDAQVTVMNVIYNPATFQATITLVSPLPIGSYRLFICGTTSIVDLAGNPLNGGTDYTFDFIVQAAEVSSAILPKTGFPQNEVTTLPLQPANKVYASTDLWLEIPKQGVKMSIVGVPQIKDGWDVTWLNKDAGWLNGSAFPTWNGNSVITGHVWDALNRPGPFAELKNLKYGDQIKIHAFGQVYTYEVRESKLISSSNKTAVFKHQEKSWITLVTCENYEEQSKDYLYRRMIRAVLISVAPEK